MLRLNHSRCPQLRDPLYPVELLITHKPFRREAKCYPLSISWRIFAVSAGAYHIQIGYERPMCITPVECEHELK